MTNPVTIPGKKKPYAPLDGIARSIEEERDLNILVARVFCEEAGHKVLEWLEVMTLRRVLPPTAPDNELRDLEGQRRLVAIIKQRIHHGRHREPFPADTSPDRATEAIPGTGRSANRRKP